MQELDGNAEQIRAKLICAAQELFITAGYHETTTRMISSKAGIDSRSFSYLFGSKEELLIQVVQQVAEDEIDELVKIASGRQGPVQMLAAVIHGVFSYRKSRELMIGLVKKRSVVVNHMLRESIMEKVCPLSERLIRAGINAGEMSTVEPAETAKLLVSNMLYAYNCVAEMGAPEQQRLFNALIHLAEATLGIEPGRLGRIMREFPPLTA